MMSNIKKNTELGLDENLKPLKTAEAIITQQTFFEANFTPPFPAIDNTFKANRFTYASLTSDSASIIGRFEHPETMTQIAIIIPRELESGEHPIKNASSDDIYCRIVVSGVSYGSESGTLTITRDKNNQSVTAEFNFTFTYTGDIYTASGKLFLLATGPL
jgi:hypothetical protein